MKGILNAMESVATLHAAHNYRYPTIAKDHLSYSSENGEKCLMSLCLPLAPPEHDPA